MVERFAREKRLNPLKTYLSPRTSQPDAMDVVAHLQAARRRGKAVKIVKVQR